VIETHGMAHALHRILEAADQLREQKDVVFLLVGSGAQREALVEQAESMALDNVRFLSRQPKEMMAAVWSLCDVSLIQLKDDPLFRSVIPSKIFESMGMGLPIILSLPEGETSEIVKKTGAGIVIAPEQPDKLVRAVLELYNDISLRSRLAKASAAAAVNYSRERQAAMMIEVLERVVAGESIAFQT